MLRKLDIFNYWIAVVSFFLIVLGDQALAQPVIQWQRALGGNSTDISRSIKTTSDGGYILVGNTASTDGDVVGYHGFTDIWVVKLSFSGNIEWSKTLGGTNEEWGYDIQQTNDAGFVVVGYTASTDGDISSNHGAKDIWVVKLDNSGQIVWQKTLGGSGNEAGLSIRQTTDGGFVVAGNSNSSDGDVTSGHGFLDVWVVKLNPNGDLEWQKSYGGTSADEARVIQQTKEGGYIIAGQTASNNGDVTWTNGNVDVWILKISDSGNIEWQKSLGGCCLDVATDILESQAGYLVCGYVGSNDGDISVHRGLFDFWVLELNPGGTILWQKTFGGSDSDYARSITQTQDGMIVVAGETKSSDGDVPNHNGIQVVWLMQLKNGGEMVWQKTLGGSDGEGCYSIQPTPDNGLIFAGYAWSHDGDVSGVHGQSDFWVVKLAPESVGVKEIPGNNPGELQLTPNPAYETTRIQAAEIETSLQIEVLDVLGRKMQAQTLLNGETMGVSDLPIGLYFVHAVGDSGQRYMGRILKQ